MIVPWQELSDEALQGVIQEFITREGTDYGHGEHTLAAKMVAVKRQLAEGSAVLVFDDSSESCSIRPSNNGKLL